jgi:hypothetical protein
MTVSSPLLLCSSRVLSHGPKYTAHEIRSGLARAALRFLPPLRGKVRMGGKGARNQRFTPSLILPRQGGGRNRRATATRSAITAHGTKSEAMLRLRSAPSMAWGNKSASMAGALQRLDRRASRILPIWLSWESLDRGRKERTDSLLCGLGAILVDRCSSPQRRLIRFMVDPR